MAESYKDCAKRLEISAEVDAYLRGDLDIDDPAILNSLNEKQIEAMRKQYQAEIDAAAWGEMLRFIDTYRDGRGRRNPHKAAVSFLTQDDLNFSGSGVEQQMDAVAHGYMGRLNELFEAADNRTLRQKLWSSGAINTDGFADDIVRELFGTTTGNSKAKSLAKLWSEVAEDIRLAYNKAGGFIQKLDDWALPQRHVQARMLDAGKDEWINFTAPLLDLQRMGLATLNDARIMLDKVYDTITTNGANKIDPTEGAATGRPKLANQHAQHRALHFNDGEAWLQYAGEFGDNDIVGSMIQHIQQMSRDLALIQTMGTNPDARFRDLLHVMRHDTAMNPERAKRSTNHVENIWANMTGLGDDGSAAWAKLGSTTRALLSSAKLGGALMSSLADPANAASAAMFNGMGQVRWAKNWIKQFTPGLAKMGRERAMRMGLINQVIVDEFIGAARFSDPEVTKFARNVSNATYKLGLLTPWDRANRTAFKLSMLDAFTELPASRADIKGRMKKTLDDYGITDGDWQAIQAAKDPNEAGLINPLLLDQNTHRRFMSMIETETNRAVIKPTARTTAVTNQGQAAGTFTGELMRYLTQWKSFPLAFMQTRLTQMAHVTNGRHGDGVGFRVAYVLHNMATLGILGMVSVQAKEISKGRDPLAVKTEADFLRLFGQGLVQAGAGGLWYDAVVGLANGRGAMSLMTPPVAGAIDEIIGTALLADIDKLGEYDRRIIAEFDRKLIGAMGWVPGQSLWYVRAAWDQIVIPAAADKISAKERSRIQRKNQRIMRERGQDRWLQPGQIRLPDFQFGE